MSAPAHEDETLLDTEVDCPRCNGCGVYDDEDAFGRPIHDRPCRRCNETGRVEEDNLSIAERRARKLSELGALIQQGKSGPLVCQACQGDGCATCEGRGLIIPRPVSA